MYCVCLCSICFGTGSSSDFLTGIYNQTLKSQVERNVSVLLTEINRAERNRVGLLNLGGVRIDDNAANGLRSLWKNIHFRCEWNNNVQSCIQDFTGYEVRQIPVEDETFGQYLQR